MRSFNKSKASEETFSGHRIGSRMISEVVRFDQITILYVKTGLSRMRYLIWVYTIHSSSNFYTFIWSNNCLVEEKCKIKSKGVNIKSKYGIPNLSNLPNDFPLKWNFESKWGSTEPQEPAMNPPQEYIKVFDLSRPTCAFYIVTEVSFCFDDVYFYRNYATVAKCLFSVYVKMIFPYTTNTIQHYLSTKSHDVFVR